MSIKYRVVSHPMWPLYKSMRDLIAKHTDFSQLEQKEIDLIKGFEDAVETYDIADPEFKQQWELLNNQEPQTLGEIFAEIDKKNEAESIEELKKEHPHLDWDNLRKFK